MWKFKGENFHNIVVIGTSVRTSRQRQCSTCRLLSPVWESGKEVGQSKVGTALISQGALHVVAGTIDDCKEAQGS